MNAWLALFLGAVGIALGGAWGLSALLLWGLPRLSALSLRGAHRADLVLTLAALPGLLALVLTGAVVSPSVLHVTGLRLDHCSIHDHHGHLCALHHPDVPLPLLILGGLLLAGTLVRALLLFRSQRREAYMLAELEALSKPGIDSDVRIIPTSQPICHAVGGWRPRVFLSPLFLDRLSPAHLAVVLVHERSHGRRQDPFLLRLLPWLWLAGLPGGEPALVAAFRLAAEDACDAVAARTFGALNVASALVAAARIHLGSSLPAGLAFGETAIERRVRRLIDGKVSDASRLVLPLGLVLAAVILGISLLRNAEMHHNIETLLHILG